VQGRRSLITASSGLDLCDACCTLLHSPCSIFVTSYRPLDVQEGRGRQSVA
jgi:hypothetical protein